MILVSEQLPALPIFLSTTVCIDNLFGRKKRYFMKLKLDGASV
jgi:hypothetical protein